MLDKKDLEARLIGWAREYGGGRYQNIGYSSRNLLQTLIEHGGFVPDAKGGGHAKGRTAADEVDDAVRAMEAGGMFKPGRVLRCEYFMMDSGDDVKLRALRAIGLPMSAEGFDEHLTAAKTHLRRALRKKDAA